MSRRLNLAAALSAATIAASPAGAAELSAKPSAQFEALQAALRADTSRQDWAAYLSDAKALKAFLNDSPTARLEVARAYLRLGDVAAALAETQGFLALGETNPVLASEAFAALRPAYQAQLATNQAAAGRARTAFKLGDAGSLPEDIDYDGLSRRFFISQVLGKAIVAVDRRGAARTFARSPDDWPFAALKIDGRRSRLWASEVAFSGFRAAPSSAWGHSAILEYDLRSGRLLHRFDGPPKTSLADMTLAANGDPIVADGDGGGLYRLASGGFQRLDHGEFLSPQTVAFCDDPQVAFVPDYVRGLARLDLRTGKVSWFSGAHHALDGVDGLYCRGHTLFAVQNGASPMRVVSFQLDPAMTAIIGERVLDRGRPGLGDPTHGVLVGDAFYYLGNVGWPNLDDQGLFKAGVPGSTPAVVRAAVRPRPGAGGRARPRAASPSAN